METKIFQYALVVWFIIVVAAISLILFWFGAEKIMNGKKYN